jgi:hypothetical protein
MDVLSSIKYVSGPQKSGFRQRNFSSGGQNAEMAVEKLVVFMNFAFCIYSIRLKLGFLRIEEIVIFV